MKQRQDDPSRVGNSKYAKKLRLKRGRGEVSPRWMWWLEGATPRRFAITSS